MELEKILFIAIEVVVSGLISTLFLWWADRLLKYDAGFPALLFASMVAALVDQIPYFGSYLQWLVFLGIVYRFGRLVISDAIFLSVIAFAMKMVVVIFIMSYVGTLMGKDPGLLDELVPDTEVPVNPDMLMVEEMLQTAEDIHATQLEHERKRVEKESVKDKPEAKKPSWFGGAAKKTAEPKEASQSFRDQYKIGAIATKGDDRFVVINGVVYREGGTLKNHFNVRKIEEERVQVEKDGALFWLYW